MNTNLAIGLTVGAVALGVGSILAVSVLHVAHQDAKIPSESVRNAAVFHGVELLTKRDLSIGGQQQVTSAALNNLASGSQTQTAGENAGIVFEDRLAQYHGNKDAALASTLQTINERFNGSWNTGDTTWY